VLVLQYLMNAALVHYAVGDLMVAVVVVVVVPVA
jgi:hypothetical protein